MTVVQKIPNIISLFVLLISTIGYSQNSTAFEEANTLYNASKYQEAITKYESILKEGNHSTALYYNLGNAYYKLNKIGPSIYYYEKALLLEPTNEDVLNNLAFAQNMTIDAIEPLPQNGVSKMVNAVLGKLTYNQWAWFAVIFVFLFVITFLWYQFSYSTMQKRTFFVLSCVSLLLVFVGLGFAYQQHYEAKKQSPAIVFAKEAKIKAEPNLRSNEAFVLHEGTKVMVLETVSDWKKIKLIDGKIGWIPASDIKEL